MRTGYMSVHAQTVIIVLIKTKNNITFKICVALQIQASKIHGSE